MCLSFVIQPSSVQRLSLHWLSMLFVVWSLLQILLQLNSTQSSISVALPTACNANLTNLPTHKVVQFRFILFIIIGYFCYFFIYFFCYLFHFLSFSSQFQTLSCGFCVIFFLCDLKESLLNTIFVCCVGLIFFSDFDSEIIGSSESEYIIKGSWSVVVVVVEWVVPSTYEEEC